MELPAVPEQEADRRNRSQVDTAAAAVLRETARDAVLQIRGEQELRRDQKRGKEATTAEAKAAKVLKDADVKLAGSWM